MITGMDDPLVFPNMTTVTTCVALQEMICGCGFRKIGVNMIY